MSNAKRNARRLLILSTAAATALSSVTSPLLTQRARAANVYWDSDANGANNTLGGGGLGGAGTWNTSTSTTPLLNWWPGTGTADQSWANSNNDTAIFSGTAGTVTLGDAVSVGGLTFNTNAYTITGSGANTLTLNAGSNSIDIAAATFGETISAQLAGSNGFTLNGTGAYGNGNTTGGILTLSSTAPLVEALTGTININNGELQVLSQNVALQATTNLSFGGTGTFRYDNNGATAATAQTLGTLSFLGGDGTITAARSTAQNVTVNIGTLASRSPGAVGLFVDGGSAASTTNGTNVKTTIASFGSAVTPSASLIDPGIFFSTGTAGPYAFAAYDSAGFVRALVYGTDANSATVATGATLGANTGKNVQMTGAITAQGTDNVNTLNISGASNLTLAAGATLGFGEISATLSGETGVGAILKTGGNAATITGGTGITANISGGELIIRTDLAADALTIATPIRNGTGALTKSGAGTLTLSAANAYTGSTFINAGTLVAQGPAALPSTTGIVLTGGTLSLQDDGDGLGDLQNINLGQNVTVSAGGGITVGRLGAIALNKTIQLGSLTIGNQVLTVTPNNGYGLQFTGGTTLTDFQPTTINVAGTQTSNNVSGLTLSGVVSDTSGGLVGLTKTGTGTLVLGNAANSFGDGSSVIDIQGGVLSVGSDAALGASSNVVVLDTNNAAQGLRLTGTDSYAHTIVLGQAANDIDVTSGATATLASALSIPVAGSVLTKNDDGTLVFSAANPANWSGGLVINSGTVQVSAANQVGTGTITVNVNGVSSSTLQLSGSNTFTNAFTLTSGGGGNQLSFGTHAGGMLELTANSTATLSGLVTLGQDSSIGADGGATLTLSGTGNGITGNHFLGFITGAGATINVQTIWNNPYAWIKSGPGTLNIQTNQATAASGSASTIFGGTVDVSGSGVTWNQLTKGLVIDPTGALTLDDTAGTGTVSRLGGATAVTMNGGTFDYIVNGTASTETEGALTIGGGGTTINIDDTSGGTNTLTFASLTQNGGASVNFTGTLGTANNKIVVTAAANGAFFARDTVNGADFATYSTTTGITAFSAYNVSNNLGTAAATDTMKLTASANQLAFAQTLNALAISASSINVGAAGGGGVLTLSSGGLLVTGTGDTISIPVVALGGNEGIFHVNASTSSATMNGSFTGTAGLTKADAGSLTLAAPQYYTGATTVNGGTLQLAAGATNTLFYNNGLNVNAGATLDLNGGVQAVGALNSAGASFATGITGGSIISTPGSGTLETNGGGTFAGTISGSSVALVRSGGGTLTLLGPLTYGTSGGAGTLINGGLTILADNGAIASNNAITINYATLQLDNSRLLDSSTRLNPAAPITLNGGALQYNGRAATLSTETVGAVTLNQGLSLISAANGSNTTANNIEGATLILSSLTRVGDSIVDFGQQYQTTAINTATSALGIHASATGQSENILVTGGIPLTNNLIGGWAVVSAYANNNASNSAFFDFASYNSQNGVGMLSTAGFAGYDAAALPATTGTAAATQNIKIGATATLATGGSTTINALNLTAGAASTLTFTAATDTLNLTSGGLMVSGNFANSLGAAVNSGRITAGGTASSGTSDLYLYNVQNTLTINSEIVNNPNGALVQLVANGLANISGFGASTITLAGNNTYTGGTIVNGETLTVAATGFLPAGGAGLTINNGTVSTAVAQGAGPVGIASQAVTLNGSSTLTLLGNNALTSITFNNTGGTAAPTVTTGGVLSLPGGSSISASSSNVATTATIAGTLDFGGATPIFAVNPISFNGQILAPLQATLNVSAIIQNANGLTINSPAGGVLQLGGASTFGGGVNLAAGSLIIGGSSTPSAVGSTVTSGPLGTGTLTIASGTTLLSSAANTVANALSIPGNVNFNGLNSLTLNGNAAISAGVASNFNVVAPQMTTTLGGVVSGSGSSIVKSGLGTLVLNNNNTFTGGVRLNSGTLLATGINGSSASPLGTGLITLNGGSLQLKNNGFSSNSNITFGNNVTISSSLADAFIDINNNGANTGNTFVFGTLTENPSTILNITGGNGYKIQFGGTNLTTAFPNTPASFNPGSGLTLILPGGFTDSNRPVNIGLGILAFSGNNSFSSPTTISGTQSVSAPIGTTTTPYGTGNVVLSNGSTLQLLPTAVGGNITSSGFTTPGLTGRYMNLNTATDAIVSTQLSSIVPAAVLPGQFGSDASFAIRPVGVANQGNFTDGMAFYGGLLNITTGGTYTFQSSVDDALRLTIDGNLVINQNSTVTTGSALAAITPVTVNLSAGLHQINLEASNQGGNGGFTLLYGGPDTAGNQLTVTGGGSPALQGIALANLLSNTSPASAANTYQNGAIINNSFVVGTTGQTTPTAATIDALGTDLNTLLGTLTIAANGTTNSTTLTTNNLGGQGFIGVTGVTTIQGAGAIVNPNTGTLELLGGVTDGGSGLTKTGPGTLVLGNGGVSTNTTFTGPLTVSTGYLQVADAGALPASASTTIASGAVLDLNGITNVGANSNITISGTGVTANKMTGTPAALYNSSFVAAGLSSSSTLAIGAAGTAIGGYGNINLAGAVLDGSTAGVGWSKVGPDVVSLGGSNSFTGVVSIASGGLQLANSGAAGSVPAAQSSQTFTTSATVTDPNTSGLAVGMVVSGTGIPFGDTIASIVAGTSFTLTTAPTAAGTGLTFAAPFVTTSGAFIDLDGQSITTTKQLTLAGLGATGLPANNTLGALINTSATAASYSGNVNITGGAVSIGSSNFNNSTPGGDILLTGTISGTTLTGVGINKVGLDNLTIQGQVLYTTGGTNLQLGTTTLSGALGQFTGGSPVNLQNGAALTFNNANNNLNNRYGGAAIQANETINGALTIIGNSAGTQELIAAKSLSFTNSGSTILLQPDTAGSLILNITSNTAFSYTAGATSLFLGNGLGTQTLASLTSNSSPNAAGFGDGTQANPGFIGQNGTGAAVGILPWALIDIANTGNGISFASYNVTNGFQTLTQIGGSIATLTTNDNVIPTANASTTSAVTAINSLTLNNGVSLTVNSGNVMQLLSGGLLGIGTTSIAGPGAITAGATAGTANGQFIIHTPNPDAGGTTTLTISAPINTTGGLTKADGGVAILQTPEIYTGQTTINGGKLTLAGGNQTLFMPFEVAATPGTTALATAQGQVLQANLGGTLDLNGNSQTVQLLTSAVTTDLVGGTITNSSATRANFRVVMNNNAETFAGSIAGNINFIRDGQNTLTLNSPQTYTGSTTLTGGVTVLSDFGALATSAIDIRRSTLRWDNTGYEALGNRLTNGSGAIPITLDGGSFQFSGRSGTADVATIGNVVLSSGSNAIQIAANNGSAQLNIGTLSRTTLGGGTVTFTAGIGGPGTNGGSFGDNPRLFMSAAPTLVNGMLGGWAVVNGEAITGGSAAAANTTTQAYFATYDPATGIRGLSSYQTVGLGNAGNTFVLNGNTQLNASAALPAGGAVINSLTMDWAAITLSFNAGTDTLNLQSGGLLSGTDANLRTVGASVNSGKLTAGGNYTAGSQPAGVELFLHSGSGSGLTINSSIVDNTTAGAGNTVPVTVVLDGLSVSGSVITLTGSNTYTGTTFDNGVIANLNSGGTAIPGNLIISSATNQGSDSETATSAAVNLNAANQTAATSNITVLGSAQFNTNGFINPINNLTFTNDAGSSGAIGGSVSTFGTGGTNALAISGTLAASTVGVANSNNLANLAQGFTIPTANGLLNFTNGSPTVSVDPTTVPGQIGLELNAAIGTPGNNTALSIIGGGTLGIGGQQTNFVGGLNPTGAGTTIAFGVANVSFQNSQVNLASGTSLDARGLSGTIGSLVGSGTLTNVGTAAGTLVTGYDNTTGDVFSGSLTNPIPQGLLNVTKVGTGDWNLTANNVGTGLVSPNLGTLTVSGGSVTLNGASAALGFGTYTLNTGGALNLTDTTNDLSNRLGGQFLLLSPVVNSVTTGRTLNMQGGSLNVLGNTTGGTFVTEGVGQLNDTAGGFINLTAAGTSGVVLSVVNVGAQGGQTSLRINADNLGIAAPGTAGDSNVTVSGTYAIPGTQGAGAAGTTLMPIRADIVATDTVSGVTGFVFNGGANGLRLLNPSTEYLTTTSGLVANAAVAAANAFNLALSSTSAQQTLISNTPAGSLTLQNGGGLSNGLGTTGGSFGGAGFETLVLGSGGLLALSGNTGINVASVSSVGTTMDIHVVGASTTLAFNSGITATTNGIVKADDGTLSFNQPQYFSGTNGTNGLTINGGKVVLNSGAANTILVSPGAAVPTLQSLFMNSATATLDLGGQSQMFERISSINPLPGQGGTITSAAAANLFTVNASGVNTTYSGSITGAISFYKEGFGNPTGGNTVLTSSNGYTGSTNILGGTLALRDSGALTATSAININYAQLLLDNTGLSDSTTRITSSVPINMTGGTFTVSARQAVDSENIGTVSLLQGLNQISLLQYNNNNQTGSYSLNVGNLVQQSGATINFPNGGGVILGQAGGNPHVFLNQLNGQTTATAVAANNGILGGWAVVNGTDFAGYTNTAGVVPLGGVNGSPAYAVDAIGGGVATDNINASTFTLSATPAASTTLNVSSVNGMAVGQSVSGTGITGGTTIAAVGTTSITLSVAGTAQTNAQTLTFGATDLDVTGRTVNSLRLGTTTAVGLASYGDVLNVGTGGLLQTANATVQGGQLTAGGTSSSPASLYTFTNAGTLTINSQISNNAASNAVVTLVRSGNGTLTLTPQSVVPVNSYASGATLLTTSSTTGTTGTGVNGLFVGELVTGTGITAGTTIASLTAGSITLSAATTAATNGITDLSFSPPAIAASTTSAGSTAVTLGTAAPAGIIVGMAVGGPNIAGGTTVAAISGTSLTLSQPAIATGTANATITLGAVSNSYTGGTVTNGGSSIFGSFNVSPLAGGVAIPGDLSVGNTTVTVTVQGGIASTSNVTVSSGGTLSFAGAGTNTLNTVTFNSNGSSGGSGNIQTGALLNISSSNAITATNLDLGHTPTIGGFGLALTNAVPTINATASSLSPDDLTITAPIASAGGQIQKTGTGSVVLGPSVAVANAVTTAGSATVTVPTTAGLLVGEAVTGTGLPAGEFVASILSGTTFTVTTGTGVTAGTNTETFAGSVFSTGVNLAAGSIIFSGNSNSNGSTILSGPVGTGTLVLNGTANSTILSDGTARTIGNPVTVNGGGFTFGGDVAGNGLTLSGPVTLAAGANSINVAAPTVASTISGVITGGTNLTKIGQGILILSNTTNSFGGSTIVTNGVLKAGVASATNTTLPNGGFTGPIPQLSQVVVAPGGEFDIAGVATLVASIAGNTPTTGGVITDSGAAATLTIGYDNLSPTFAGIITNAANALTLTKVGTGNETLSGANLFTGAVNINVGQLTITNSSALGVGAKTISIVNNSVGPDSSLHLNPNGGPAISLASNLTFTLSQSGGIGTIINDNGNNTIAGPINVTSGGGSSNINVTSGSLTLSGNITVIASSRNLGLRGNGNGLISGVLADSTGDGMTLLKEFGSGTWTLNNVSTASFGNMDVTNGSIVINGAGKVAFLVDAVSATGTLALDNSGTNVASRLGGKPLSLTGGTFTLNGNNGAAASETVSTLTLGSGGSTIAVTGAGGLGTTLTATTLAAPVAGASALLTGDNLNLAAGSGNATVLATTFNVLAGQTAVGAAGDANGLTTKAIRADIIADNTLTGTGTGFLTKDSVTGNLRPLAAGELASTLSNNSVTNFGNFATAQSFSAASAANSLTFNTAPAGGSLISAGGGQGAQTVLSSNVYQSYTSSATLNAMTLTTGGVLTTATTSINGGELTTLANANYVVHTTGTSVLDANTYLAGTTGGLTKADAGTLKLDLPTYYTGATTVNGGTLLLNSGAANTLAVIPTATTPTVQNLVVNGGLLDLSGQSQAVGSISSSNAGNTTAFAGPGTAGNITSSAAANLISSTGTSTSYGGVIGGAINFFKAGTGTLTLTTAQTYTGPTAVQGGTLNLTDNGSVASTAISVNGATFTLGDQGVLINPTRVPTAANITLNSGTLNANGAGAILDSFSLATTGGAAVAVNQGSNAINSNTSTGGTNPGGNVLTIGNLTRAAGTAVTFTGMNLGQLGSTNNFGLGTTRIVLSNVNGSAVGLTNGVIGGWATVAPNVLSAVTTAASATVTLNGAMTTAGLWVGEPVTGTGIPAGEQIATIPTSNTFTLTTATGVTANTGNLTIGTTDFAGYASTGVGALNTSGFAAYSSSNLNTAGATDNVRITATPGASVNSGTTINSLNIANPAAATAVTLAGSLNIGTGGLIFSDPQAKGISITGGTLTAGTTSSPAELFAYVNTSAAAQSISSQITDNGTGGSVSFEKNGTGNLVLSPTGADTYTGATYANQGTLTLGAAAGTVVVPGNLVINNGGSVVESVNAGQIASTTNVSINGGGVLTLTGSNTLNNLTINNNGGTTTPAVNAGTTLTLTGNISEPNDNLATTSTITGGTLALTAAAPTITTSGLSADDLIIASQITSTNPITKLGAGSLVLPNANTAVLNWNLNAGTLILNNAASLGAAGGSLNIAGPATLEAGSAAVTTNAIPVTIAAGGSLTFGGAVAANSLNLGGAVALPAGANTIAVSSPLVTGTITGQLSGGTNLTKSGPGILALANGTNNYGGTTTVAGGILQLGNAAGVPAGSMVQVNSGAEFDIAGKAGNIGSLTGDSATTGGLVTNSGVAAVLTIGNDNTNQSFAGVITNATNNLSLTKVGTGTQALSGANTYTGPTNINNGILLANTSIPTASATGSGPVTINTAATLAGGTSAAPGFIASLPTNTAVTVTSGGTISAGNGITSTSTTGLLVTSGGNGSSTYSHVWAGNGNYAWKVNGSATTGSTPQQVSNGGATVGTTDTAGGANWDMLSVQTLNVTATSTTPFNINVVPLTSSTGFNPNGVYTWTIADVTGANGIYLNGSNSAATLQGSTSSPFGALLAALNLNAAQLSSQYGANGSGFSLGVTSDGAAGEDIVINYNAAPEPTSLMLLGLGAGGLLLRRRRRQTV